MSTISPTSYNLARLLGPALTVVTMTEAMNSHIWSTNTAPVVYLNGTILFVAGLSLVQNHNIWTLKWPIFITLIGWGALGVGAARMLWPEKMLEGIRKTGQRQFLGLTGFLGAVGGFLWWKAYT